MLVELCAHFDNSLNCFIGILFFWMKEEEGETHIEQKSLWSWLIKL